ncbi:MAG: hypothetical protein IJV15_14970 [Lachnospiraceae bacterium]|nr:hypothetical protein [Lachnospiraceae bacterium]
MRLKRILTSFLCGVMLVVVSGAANIDSKAEIATSMGEEILEEQAQDDSLPRLKKCIIYNGDGSIVESYKYEYDEDGNMKKEQCLDEDKTPAGYRTFEYDEDGNVISFTIYYKDGSAHPGAKYEYEKNGNITKKIYNDDSVKAPESENMALLLYEAFEYDKNGNVTKKTSVCTNEKFNSEIKNTYDENGNLKESNSHDGIFGDSSYKYEYKYDENGRIKKETCFDNNNDGNQIYYYTYEYDNNGNLKEESYYYGVGDEITEKKLYDYDADGNLILYTVKDRDDITTEKTKYDYDEDGNLIKVTPYRYDGTVDSYWTYEYYSSDESLPGASTISEDSYSEMYRLYNPNSGEHFYTANESERDTLSGLGWKYEGVAWNAPKTSDTPVYRLYNPNAGDHHYTTSKSERDNLVGYGWKDEGIGWYSTGTDGQALHRLYNPNATGAGSHHYTTSETEKDNLVGLGWRYEGIAWYGGK